MNLRRARIIHSPRATRWAATSNSTETVTIKARVEPRERVEAALEAQAIRARAQSQAEQLLQQAQMQRDAVFERALQEAQQSAAAELAGAWIKLRQREAQADEAALDRSIALARLLAERLLGQALELEPSTVVALAREAMTQLWRADRIRVLAHPEDARILREHLDKLGHPSQLVQVLDDASLDRGNLRMESNLGTLDATVGEQLDRLAKVLGQELKAR